MKSLVKINRYDGVEVDGIVYDETPFVVSDIAGILKELNIESAINVIDMHCCDLNEKKNIINKIINNAFDDEIYIVESFASLYEYTKDRYYLFGDKCEDSDREKLPLEDILKDNNKILEEIGFVSINDFIKYEYKNPYIYPNTIGQKIINYINTVI